MQKTGVAIKAADDIEVGYTNIVELGGINARPGEIVADQRA